MGPLAIVLTVIQVISGIVLTVIVLLQSGKTSGLSGAIAGGADTFLSKNKAKSWDSKLARVTKYFAIGFMFLTLLICILV